MAKKISELLSMPLPKDLTSPLAIVVGGVTYRGTLDDLLVEDRWDDAQWLGQGVNPPGSVSPAVLTEVATNHWEWVFSNNNSKAFPAIQFPHMYKEGTDCIAHLHWIPTTTGTYTGTWTAIFNMMLTAESGEVFETPLTTTAAFNFSATAGQLVSQNFTPNIPGTGRKISSLGSAFLKLTLTAGASCILKGFDGHIERDRLGSVTSTSKE